MSSDGPTLIPDHRPAGLGCGRPTEISSLATYVPPRLLTNADLEKLVDTSSDWILQRTGIHTRHIVDPGVATVRAYEYFGLPAPDRDQKLW